MECADLSEQRECDSLTFEVEVAVANNVQESSDQVTVDDIVFDCPHCGKSLAIDRRGAGLTIRCPDCLQYVQVPGVSLAEREAEAGQSETQTANPAAFSEALGTSRKKIDQLLADLEEIRERRRYLEKVRSDNLARFDLIGKDLAIIQNAMDRIVTLLQDATTERRSENS